MKARGRVTVTVDGHVAVVTLDRPSARNAFDADMLVGLADAWDRVDDDHEIRCVILTGAEGHFCAGADLTWLGRAGEVVSQAAERLKADAGLAWKGLLRSHRLSKPLIAAVEGYAVAGGTEILQATDIRVAGRGATFGITEAARGLFPLGGSTVRLRRQIPHALAMEMLLTARHVTAQEAFSFGLINRVVDDGEALATAQQIADQIVTNGPVAVQTIKRSVLESEWLPEREALASELQIGMPVFSTEDAKEGPRAFAEKRPPTFRGR